MYKIAILRHAYYPDLQGLETVRFAEGEFETVDDAIATVREMDGDIYIMEHGESGRPTLIVVDDVDADYVASGRNQDGSNYDWTVAECECGECAECLDMMIHQDRAYLRSNALFIS